MGVHTGDSVTVAPQQTLTDRQYQELRDQAIAVIRAVGVETGGSNVQFAVNPATDEIVVIEMNPRVSRSSALASKATGFPIAKIAARLAVGYTLDEIPNDITRVTPASFEPVLDYCVVKWPRFAFEKFPGVDERLTTHMKSVGEVMAIGRTFEQAFGKAMRSRELDSAPDLDGRRRRAARPPRGAVGRPLRHRARAAAPRRGGRGDPRPDRDRPLVPAPPAHARHRARAGLRRGAHLPRGRHLRGRVRGRDAVLLLRLGAARRPSRGVRGDKPSVLILGSGPNRIGQGIEFDYCCVHAAMTVRESGRDAVMVNCNPETVSTDYDTSDRLYFEPLTHEDVLAIVEAERPEGVIVQFGGQTPLKLAAGLDRGRRAAARHPASTRSTSPRTAGASAACSSASGSASPPYATAHSAEEARGARAGGRLPAAGAPELRARRARDGDRLRRRAASRTTCAGWRATAARSTSTASSRTPSRSTSTRSATARRSGSAASCSTSRRPASTPATRPACCRRTRSAARCSTRSAHATRELALALGVVGLINVQYAVMRRRALRDRGQPARLAHGAVRLQGDRPAAGQARLPRDARREARRR